MKNTPQSQTSRGSVFYKLLNWVLSHVFAKVVIGLILAVVAIAATRINHDELAIHTRFGKHVGGPLPPGLHFFFPYMDEIRRYSTVLQFLLITDKAVRPDVTFQEIYFNEGVAFTTSDNVDAKVVLEIVYGIEKNADTLDHFVASFGRIESKDGTEKIEKLVADTTRSLTRSVLSQVEFRAAETEIMTFSRILRDLSNNPTNMNLNVPQQIQAVLPSLVQQLQHPYLSELGVRIHRLGYRIQGSRDFLSARTASGAALETARNREEISKIEKQASLAEYEAEAELLAKQLELAKIRTDIFAASPDSDRQKVILKLIDKWDGRLPQVMASPDGVSIADAFQMLPEDPANVRAEDVAPKPLRPNSSRPQ